jgi:hypothetical protein
MTQKKRADRPLNERIGFWLTLGGLLLAVISIALYIWTPGFAQPVLRTFHLIVLSLWIIGLQHGSLLKRSSWLWIGKTGSLSRTKNSYRKSGLESQHCWHFS